MCVILFNTYYMRIPIFYVDKYAILCNYETFLMFAVFCFSFFHHPSYRAKRSPSTFGTRIIRRTAAKATKDVYHVFHQIRRLERPH